jgi:mycobactin polyketide synthetase MbtD
VQWGRWTVHLDLDAAGRAKLAGSGVVAMSPAGALAHGMGDLRRNAIVAAFDLDRARPALETLGYGPVFSQLMPKPAGAVEPVDTTDVSQRFVKLLAEVIGLDNADGIDTTIPMVAIGLDSLQALEFRKRVQVEFDYELDVADMLSGASIDDALTKLSALPRVTGIDAVDVTQRARRAADKIVPVDLDVARMCSARADLDIVGMGAMMNALRPALSRDGGRSADAIADRLEFAPRHRWLLNRWLRVLSEHGHLVRDTTAAYRLGVPVPEPNRPDLYALCDDLGYPAALADFMLSCNEHLTELAQDRITIQQLLFADGEMATAVAGYRDNVVGQYLNRAAREVISAWARERQRYRSPVRVLELGAGTGGTTDDVIAGLSGMEVDYHFTDVSQFFLRAARERFGDHPLLRYGIVDLNADLPRQEHCDIVVAANVLHNALDIADTLRQVHSMINPGGALIFLETCTANYQLLTSLKFLMSPNPGEPHPGGSDIRKGTRIFLSEDEWCAQLSATGFAPLPVLPTPEHPLRALDQRLFVAARH